MGVGPSQQRQPQRAIRKEPSSERRTTNAVTSIKQSNADLDIIR